MIRGSPLDSCDIPDIIELFHNHNKEVGRERTEQSVFVSVRELIGNDRDLSINKYKKTKYVAVEYPPTSEFLAEIDRLNAEIERETAEIRKLRGE